MSETYFWWNFVWLFVVVFLFVCWVLLLLFYYQYPGRSSSYMGYSTPLVMSRYNNICKLVNICNDRHSDQFFTRATCWIQNEFEIKLSKLKQNSSIFQYLFCSQTTLQAEINLITHSNDFSSSLNFYTKSYNSKQQCSIFVTVQQSENSLKSFTLNPIT